MFGFLPRNPKPEQPIRETKCSGFSQVVSMYDGKRGRMGARSSKRRDRPFALLGAPGLTAEEREKPHLHVRAYGWPRDYWQSLAGTDDGEAVVRSALLRARFEGRGLSLAEAREALAREAALRATWGPRSRSRVWSRRAGPRREGEGECDGHTPPARARSRPGDTGDTAGAAHGDTATEKQAAGTTTDAGADVEGEVGNERGRARGVATAGAA